MCVISLDIIGAQDKRSLNKSQRCVCLVSDVRTFDYFNLVCFDLYSKHLFQVLTLCKLPLSRSHGSNMHTVCTGCLTPRVCVLNVCARVCVYACILTYTDAL